MAARFLLLRLFLFVLSFAIVLAPAVFAQQPDADFKGLVARIVHQRLNSGESDNALVGRALALLDGIVLPALNLPGGPNLDTLNQRLSTLVAQQPPVGENYRLFRLSGSAPAYALLVNFSLSGPSAVRLYAVVNGPFALIAKIDAVTFPDFVDEYLELVPITSPDTPVFVTVSGRTDALSTGVFRAWRLTSGKIESLWASDFLEQTKYSSSEKFFQIEFCADADTDPSKPRACRLPARYRFVWEAGQWKLLEGPPSPPSR